jgi:hypothetical protein
MRFTRTRFVLGGLAIVAAVILRLEHRWPPLVVGLAVGALILLGNTIAARRRIARSHQVQRNESPSVDGRV